MIGNLLSNKFFLLMSSNIAHSLFWWCRNCVQDNYYSLANVLHSMPLSPWFLIYYFLSWFSLCMFTESSICFFPFCRSVLVNQRPRFVYEIVYLLCQQNTFLANHGNAIAYFGLKWSIYDNRIKNVSWTLISYFEFKISANACALPMPTLNNEEEEKNLVHYGMLWVGMSSFEFIFFAFLSCGLESLLRLDVPWELWADMSTGAEFNCLQHFLNKCGWICFRCFDADLWPYANDFVCLLFSNRAYQLFILII